MQTVFSGIDCSQLLRKIEWVKRKYGENYSPFSGKQVPVVSMDEVKEIMVMMKEIKMKNEPK